MRITFVLILTFLCFYSTSAQGYQEKILKSKIDSLHAVIAKFNKEMFDIQSVIRQNDSLLNYFESQLNEIKLSSQDGETYVCTMGTSLYSDFSFKDKICNVVRGDKVKVIEILEDKFKVYYNDHVGYVLIAGFKSEALLTAEKNDKEEGFKRKEEAQRQFDEETKRAADKIKNDLIKKYGTTTGLKIYLGEIWIGMTKQMLLDSKGYPKNINKTVNTVGVHEQWVYETKFVYLDNDIVTSWQE